MFFGDYVTNLDLTNAKSKAERSLGIFSRIVEVSYFRDRLFCELRSWIFLAFDVGVSSLINHVSSIVALVSYKKMIWPNAGRIVAFVENQKPKRDWTKMQFVTNSMGEKKCSIDFNSPVAVPDFAASPFPAVFSLFNMLHEPLFECHEASYIPRFCVWQSSSTHGWGAKK